MAAVATARTKCTIHVSSLASEVTKEVLHAAFIPFGEIVDIQIPLNEDGCPPSFSDPADGQIPPPAGSRISSMSPRKTQRKQFSI
jgi:hypothetical protein